MIEKLFTLSFEGSWRRISKPFLSRGVEILDGGFARPKVNIDVSRARPLSIVFLFFFFFFPPSIEYEDIIDTVVSLRVSSVSIVGRDELE